MSSALFGVLKSAQPGPLSHFPVVRCLATAELLSAIKHLREQTGAPISDVKAALEETSYDQSKAFQALRKRGLAAATKKASRRAAEGLIGLARSDRSGAVVEVNTETDFVARNDQFKSLVTSAAQAVLLSDSLPATSQTGPIEIAQPHLSDLRAKSGQRLEDLVQETAGTMRENICLRRAFRLEAPNGVLASYLHISPSPGLGRIGTLLAIEPKQNTLPANQVQRVQDAGNRLAMHAAAASPQYLDRHTVPEEALEGEKAILREQAAKTGKSAAIVEKMILGRLNKFYEEVCFLEQPFIMDDALKVKDVLKTVSDQVGVPLAITGFVRLQCGEGLEEEEVQQGTAEQVRELLNEAF